MNRPSRSYRNGAIVSGIVATLLLLEGIYNYVTIPVNSGCGIYFLGSVILFGCTIFFSLKWQEIVQEENSEQK